MSDIFQSRPELAQFQLGSTWRVSLGSSPHGVISPQHLPYDGKIGEVVGYNEEIPGLVNMEAMVYPIRLKVEDETLPEPEQSFAPFQLEPIWRKEVRDYITERQAAYQRQEVSVPYHRVIERISERYSADIEEVQSYFFEEFQKTPEYQVLQHQGEVHG
jgi:hypothetical protein